MAYQNRTGTTNLNQDWINEGSRQVPIWMPSGGISSTRFGNFHAMHRLCAISSISDGTPTFNNERNVFVAGKSRVSIFDDRQYDFTITGNGNAVELVAALEGLDISNIPVVQAGTRYQFAGDLAIFSAPSNNEAKYFTLYTDVQITFSNVAGVADGSSNITIDVQTSGTVLMSTGFYAPIKEIFATGATDAPDGTKVDFLLGNGVGTGLTNEHPIAQSYDPEDSSKRFVYVKVDGTTLATSAYSYSTTTSTLTLTTAPASSSTVEILYFTRTDASAFNAQRDYGAGEIVKYEGAYYSSDGTDAAGVLPTAPGGWTAYTGFAVDNVPAGIGAPVQPYTAGTKYDLMTSWNELMFA